MTAMPEPSAKRFLGKVLLWLAPSFAGWYLLAPMLIFPVALALKLLLTSFYPDAIATVEQHGGYLDVITRFSPSLIPGTKLEPGHVGQVLFTVNALKYSYGVPLLLALSLAVPGSWRHRLTRFVMGAILLIPLQVWGVYFDSLVTLVFKMPHVIAEQMGTTALSREGIALAYQLGYLILPAVGPIIIWAFFNIEFIKSMAPNLAGHQQTHSGS